MEVKETLKQRSTNYGSFSIGTALRATMIEAILDSYKKNNDGKEMPKFYEIAILDIVNKLTRIAVTYDHIDSWHDIAGYAMLVEEHIKQQNKIINEI